MANIRLENISKIYGVAKKKGQLPEGKKAVNNINLNIHLQTLLHIALHLIIYNSFHCR